MEHTTDRRSSYVVGIGASAGGLEALERFFDHVPASTGMAFVVMRSPAYDAYGDSAREHGLTPLGDQQLAGGMMLSLDFLVMMFALCLFFWASARDADEAEAATTRPVRA